MDKVYERINWQNEPNVSTPINAANLNKIDYAVDALDDRVIELDTASKVAKGNIDTLISKMSTAESDIDALEKGLSSTQGIVYTLRDKITKAETDIVVLQKACETLENTKAPGIICTASGEPVVITDCSDMAFSDIEVDGASEQAQYTGKNLLENKAVTPSQPQYGITFKVNDDGSVTASGTATQTVYFLINTFTYGEGTYVLSGCPSGGNAENTYCVYDDVLKKYDNGNGVKIEGGQSGKVYIRIIGGVTVSNLVFKPMVEQGTVATEYEPYIGGPSPSPEYPQPIKSVGDSGSLEIKTHVNQLLNYDAWKTVSTTHGTSVFENNGVTITATETDAYTDLWQFPDEAKIPVSKGEIVTVSWKSNIPYDGMVYIFGNGSTASMAKANNATDKKVSYVVPSGITFVTFRFGVTASGKTIQYKDIMIDKKGGLPYEPYHSNSITIPLSEPLRAYDKIVKQDGVWGVERCPEENTLDENMNWYASSVLTGRYTVTLTNVKSILLCDQAIVGLDGTEAINQCFLNSSGSFCINTGFSTLDEWKAHLAEKPLKVVCILATPTFEPFDTDTQIAINSLHGYKTVTYVSTDSEVKPTIIVDYVADTKTYIDNKFNELAAALVAGSEV